MHSFVGVLIAPGISKSLKWMRFLGPGISNFFLKEMDEFVMRYDVACLDS
jgi:hypothetical protein